MGLKPDPLEKYVDHYGNKGDMIMAQLCMTTIKTKALGIAGALALAFSGSAHATMVNGLVDAWQVDVSTVFDTTTICDSTNDCTSPTGVTVVDSQTLQVRARVKHAAAVVALLDAYARDPDALGMMVVRRVPDAVAWGAVDVRPDGDHLRVRDVLADGQHMFCGVHVTRPSVVARLPDGADGMRFLRWVAEAFEQPFIMALYG